MNGTILASIPALPACYLLAQLILAHDPTEVLIAWLRLFLSHLTVESESAEELRSGKGHNTLDSFAGKFTSSQLLAYVLVAFFGYSLTDYLIPAIKVSTLRLGYS